MPTPRIGEAVVRVRAVAINHVDLDVRAGTARIPLTFLQILGREFAGEFAAIGDSARRSGNSYALFRERSIDRRTGESSIATQ